LCICPFTNTFSASLYPQVFDEYREFIDKYSEVTVIPTRYFLSPMNVGEEFSFELEHGKTLYVKLVAVGQIDLEGNRQVYFELNGLPRSVKIIDKSSKVSRITREKATDKEGEFGAPMPGVVIDIKLKIGDHVKKGNPLLVLSAMKMETVVSSNISGVVKRILVKVGDDVKAGDLLIQIDPIQ
jgi:pyruvate carboxylase